MVAAAAALLLAPLACASLIAAPFAYRTIPLVTAETAPMYRAAAAAVQERMAAEITEGWVPVIPWKPMIAVDAVRYRQDFSLASPGAATALAWAFVERHREVHAHCEGLDPVDPTVPYCYVEVHVWYTLRDQADTLDRLGITGDDRSWFQDLMDTITRHPEVLRGG